MTPPFDHPMAPDALRDLLAGPPGDVSPLTGRPCLVFRGGAASAAEARRLGDALRALPCPTICIADREANRTLMRASDVVVRTSDELPLLLQNIAANPLAASVLVQLLRATEKLPIPDALYAESLAYATLQAGPEYRRWLAGRTPAAAPPREEGPAVVVQREGAEVSIELNRPGNRNAISVEMRDALVEAFQLVIADETIRHVRLSGRGKCFSVGGDLAEFGRVPDPATGHAVRMQALPARFLAQCADRVEVHVQSACIGAGVELPAFARRIVAAKNTFFHLPELEMGLLPGAGGTVSLPRRIGRQRAAWLMLSGKRINARTALDWGLVDSIE